MFYLLVILGLISMAAGVFVVGFGVPIRETVFGSGLLVSGSVAITGGFIMVGLAAAVAELQGVAQALKTRVPAVPRPLRPVERKDGTEKRPGPPRVTLPQRPGPDGPRPAQPNPAQPNVMPSSLEPSGPLPMERDAPARKPAGPDWLRRAMAEIESNPDAAPAGPDQFHGDGGRPMADDWPRPVNPPPLAPASFGQGAPPPAPQPMPPPMPHLAPEPAPPEPRPVLATPQNIFDMVWPSERRKTPEAPPEKRVESAAPTRAPEPWPLPGPPPPPPRAAEPRPVPVAPPPPPPPPPPPAPPRAEQRPPTILKSGVIDEMSYTLFTDGSIEAQMPDGTMRFASIEALRDHLEQHQG